MVWSVGKDRPHPGTLARCPSYHAYVHRMLLLLSGVSSQMILQAARLQANKAHAQAQMQLMGEHGNAGLRQQDSMKKTALPGRDVDEGNGGLTTAQVSITRRQSGCKQSSEQHLFRLFQGACHSVRIPRARRAQRGHQRRFKIAPAACAWRSDANLYFSSVVCQMTGW